MSHRRQLPGPQEGLPGSLPTGGAEGAAGPVVRRREGHGHRPDAKLGSPGLRGTL